MAIMTSYFRIRDDAINFFNFTRFLPIAYSYQVSASSDLNQKNVEKFPSMILFLAKDSPH